MNADNQETHYEYFGFLAILLTFGFGFTIGGLLNLDWTGVLGGACFLVPSWALWNYMRGK